MLGGSGGQGERVRTLCDVDHLTGLRETQRVICEPRELEQQDVLEIVLIELPRYL